MRELVSENEGDLLVEHLALPRDLSRIGVEARVVKSRAGMHDGLLRALPLRDEPNVFVDLTRPSELVVSARAGELGLDFQQGRR